MVKLALVNLYLHGFPNPKITEYDTLSSEKRWDENFDVILANPPFMTPKGGIVPHKRFSIQANRAEVLFVDYIAEHLSIKGRAGIIVPEGIIFQSANAYKNLRKNLIENWGLYAVVSLPSGVFQPYSGVKTSILLLDKEVAKRTDEILFLKVENDGFDLGAQRRKIDKNDLPDCFHILNQWKKERIVDESSKFAFAVKKEKIAENGDYNLTGDRYRETVDYSNAKWPMVELGEVCEIYQPKTITSKEITETGKYKVFGANGVIGYFDKYNHEDSEVAVTCRGATCGTINFTEPKSWITGNAMVLKPKDKSLNKKYLFYFLSNSNLISTISGAAQPQITRTGISPFQIPLPPLSVQEQIVAEIEQYQKVIDGAKQVVENWKPSFRIDPSWEMVELGEVCEVISGQSPEGKYYNENGDGLAFYQGKTEFQDMYIGNPTKWTTQTTKIAIKNDILMSVRAPVGPINFATQEICIGRGLASIRGNQEKISQKYLFYILRNKEKDIKGNGGAAFDSINRNDIQKIKIPLPPLAVQEQIVAEIEAEQKAIEECKKLMEKMQKKVAAKIGEAWGEEI
jgi:type I restriction enzyme M protein